MGRIIYLAVGLALAAAAFGLPGELVVISAKEVAPDEAAGLYYLGTCEAGYLYNGSSAALGAVAPYRLLDRDAQLKDYYIVWAPGWVGVTPEAFAPLGTAVRLSEYEILVGLERGLGAGDLRAVEHRIELIKLEPVTPIDWRPDAEAPPTKKDPRIAGAVNSITAEEYAGYIKQLQNFETRAVETDGGDAARDYIRNFFTLQNLDASFFPFDCAEIKRARYVDEGGTIYVDTDAAVFKRTRDGGASWNSFYPARGSAWDNSYWVTETIGFIWPDAYQNVIGATRDGGYTWKIYKIAPSEPGAEFEIYDVFFATPEVGWLGASKSVPPGRGKYLLLATADGGRTWRPQFVADAFVPRLIRAFDDDHLWVSDEVGIYYSNDGGASWQLGSGNPFPVCDLEPVGEAEAWAAVGGSRLIRTNDGKQWRYADPGHEAQLTRVEFPDRTHGFAAGDRLLATSDGGRTWRSLQRPGENTCEILSFADPSHGVLGAGAARELFITVDAGRSFRDVVKKMNLASENVVGERRGSEQPDEIVIIGGHFDSTAWPIYPADCPGADDNASGTACAMAAARAFRNMSFKRTVRYVAFGAEEQGLVGSKAYAEYCAAKGEKIVAVLNADMVCYDEEAGARDDFTASTRRSSWLYEYLKRVGRLYGSALIYDYEPNGVSDDGPFESVGYAAMGVVEGEKGEGGGTEYPWYHTAEDTLGKLHPALGVRFVRDYAAMLAHLAGVGDTLLERTPPGAGAVPFSRAFAVYPNPYRYATTGGGVNFVGIKSPATVEVYDLAGRRVASAAVAATDEFVWRPGGEALSPGVYLYRVQGRDQEETGKIVLTK
jgi:photosystem II stability/assembly factor-like uncharacterized protein